MIEKILAMAAFLVTYALAIKVLHIPPPPYADLADRTVQAFATALLAGAIALLNSIMIFAVLIN